MKPLALLLLLPVLALQEACTVAHGNAQTGSWTVASVGGDLKDVSATSEGIAAAEINNSKGLESTTKAITTIQAWRSASEMVGNLAGGATKVLKSREATKRVGITESAATQRADIAARVEQARIANPGAELP